MTVQRRQKTSGGAKSSPASSSPTGKGKGKGNGPNNVEGSPQAVAKAGALAAVLASSQASTQALAFYRVPLFMLPIYKAAAVQYGVPWQILAGINEIETDYGADQSVSSAGAVGWMQFMPETWQSYGVDALEAGYADPYNPVDAVFAAARYLRAAGAATNLRRAILAYNHSEEYVDSVMLRAKLISTYPKPVIATLTGAGGRPSAGDGGSLEWSAAHAEAAPGSATASAAAAKPKTPATNAPGTGSAVSPAAAAAAAARAQPAPKMQVVDLTAGPRASVVAVHDGRVLQIGNSRRLGHFIILRDVYGDVFTYAGLGSVAPSYTREKPASTKGTSPVVQAASTHDPAPSKAATAGSQAPVTLQVKTPAPQNHGSGGGRAELASSEDVPAGMNRQRLYAHPGNPDAKASAVAASARRAARAKAAQRLPLRAGSVVPSGTVLGKVLVSRGGQAGHLRFAIRPAGDGAYIDPGPVLSNWAELQKALHPQGARAQNALLGATAGDVFLLSRQELERTVLSDPGITITRLRARRRRLRRGRPPRARGARVPLAQRPEAHRRRAALRAEPVHERGRRLAPLAWRRGRHHRHQRRCADPSPGSGHDHRPHDPGAADPAERIRAARNPQPHALPGLAADEGRLLALEPPRADLPDPRPRRSRAPLVWRTPRARARPRRRPSSRRPCSARCSGRSSSGGSARSPPRRSPSSRPPRRSPTPRAPKPASRQDLGLRRVIALRSWRRGELRRHRPGRHEDPGSGG